ncbi:MAG: hypothetical protein IJH99_00570 [Eubacterium sp.]|nr:hypothetical protein [Eubacterium sp.]
MNSRENYLTAARGGKPEWVPVYPDEANMYLAGYCFSQDPETGIDVFGIRWVPNENGFMPEPGRFVLKDIHDWRKVVKFPDLSAMDWEGSAARFRETRDPEKVDICILNTMGLFLLPVNLMGWIEALCAIVEEPEEMEAFVSAIADFLIEAVGYVDKYIHPDIVFTGDDFAAAAGPFISKESWDTVYKKHITRINDAIHAIGALAEFHCCGNCGFLTAEFLECGSDIVQLPEPQPELEADKARFGSRLVITGGWNRHGPGNKPYASEDVVRESVRVALDTYGKDGALIFWDGGIVGNSEDAQRKMAWVVDEAKKYGHEIYKN